MNVIPSELDIVGRETCLGYELGWTGLGLALGGLGTRGTMVWD